MCINCMYNSNLNSEMNDLFLWIKIPNLVKGLYQLFNRYNSLV